MKLNLFLAERFQAIILAASLGLAVLPASVKAFPAPLWMQGGHAARIAGLACSPDGSMIASASEDGTVKLWSTNGTLLRTLNTQPYPATALAWSPDGRKIAAGTYYGGYIFKPGLGLTYLWQATSGWTSNVTLVRVSTNFYGKVSALAFFRRQHAARFWLRWREQSCQRRFERFCSRELSGLQHCGWTSGGHRRCLFFARRDGFRM